MKKITLVFFCLWLFLPAIGQITYKYDVNLGIPSSHLYGLTKDKNNLIWVASDNGVFAFNGYDHQTISLNNNDVLYLHPDSHGRIWGVNSSANLFYIKEGKAYTHENTPWIPAKLASLLVRFLNDGDITYLAHGNEIIKIQNETITQIKLPQEEDVAIKQMWKFKGNVYARFGAGYWKIDGDTVSVSDIPIDVSGVIDIVDNGDTLLVVRTGVIERLTNDQYGKPKLEKICDFPYNDDDRSTRPFADNGVLYLYSKNELFIIDIEQKCLRSFFKAKGKITGVLEDQFHNVWLTTFEQGLLQIPFRFHQIKQVMSFDQIGHTVNCFNKDRDLILGMVDGFLKVDGQLLRYTTNDRSGVRGIILNNSQYIIGGDVGLFNLNPATGKFNMLMTEAVKKIQMDGNRLFVGTSFGLHEISQNLIQQPGFAEHISWIKSRTYTFLCDRDRNIWVSCIKGFYKMQKAGSEQMMFADVPSIQAVCVQILDYSKDEIAILTGDNRIYFANKNGKESHLGYELPSSIRINQILSHKKSLWVSTNKGIIELTLHSSVKDTLVIGRTILMNPALFDSEIHQMQFKGDTLFFVNSTGLYYLIEPVYKNEVQSVPALFSAYTSNGTLGVSDHFNLRSKDRNLTLTWFDPGYSSPSFYYRIIGKSSGKWQKISRNTLHLSELRLGDQLIEVVASNGFNEPSNPIQIALHVKGKLTEYTWFQILITALILLLISGIALFWVQTRNRANSLQQELQLTEAQLKLTGLQSQMNPHFLRNCLNSIQSLIHQNEQSKASRYIAHFSQLIDQYIKLSVQNFISLESELSNIENFVALEQLRFANEFSYKLIVAPETPVYLEVPTMFLQPVVENAIEHGLIPSTKSEKRLTISITYYNEELTIEISDNGVGLNHSETQDGNSLALNNIRKRIQTINAFDDIQIDFNIFDNNDVPEFTESGTTATFIIKYFH
ncbi:MAG: hypothetical protein GC181_09870 [Bacteroidetes bacterium]|nr:hypothetical protein [Bacteroidota bacterium]